MKKSTFEDALKTDLRWPTSGDRPFVEGDHPSDNARIAGSEFARLVLMVEGYKKAADLLVDKATEDSRLRDFLVFPIIFNYRHYLELMLKYQLSTFGPSVGIQANWSTHDLSTLWCEFVNVLDKYGSIDPNETDSLVFGIISEFSKIDPGSFSFRYPYDKNGKFVELGHTLLHLPTLADVMNRVSGYFSGCAGYMSDLRDA